MLNVGGFQTQDSCKTFKNVSMALAHIGHSQPGVKAVKARAMFLRVGVICYSAINQVQCVWIFFFSVIHFIDVVIFVLLIFMKLKYSYPSLFLPILFFILPIYSPPLLSLKSMASLSLVVVTEN